MQSFSSPTTDVIARSVPKVGHWLLGIFISPICGFLLVGVVPGFFGLEPWLGFKGAGMLTAWAGATLLVAGLAGVTDYRRLYYTLHADSLVLGRGTAAVTIPFAEIESMVLSLPEYLPWWLRLQRYNPKGRHAYLRIVKSRAGAVLLRLTGNRYLPLNTALSFLAGGPFFMREFLRLNESKIVGPETYDDGEIEGLAAAKINRVKIIVRSANPTHLRRPFAEPSTAAQAAEAEKAQRFDY